MLGLVKRGSEFVCWGEETGNNREKRKKKKVTLAYYYVMFDAYTLYIMVDIGHCNSLSAKHGYFFLLPSDCHSAVCDIFK